MPQKNRKVIISLGGSLIVPDTIDTGFLKSFKRLIESGVKAGHQYLIITGGGKTARNYANAAKSLGTLNPDDLDWLGIHTTRLNAHLIRTMFKKIARPEIITDPHDTRHLKEARFPVIIAAGDKPGSSTDYDAVVLAKQFKIREILNLSNIDFVYDMDPRKFPNAKKITNIDWKDFRKIVGDKWDPGLNVPFDPVAAKLAQKLKLKVAILNGRNISNVKNYLDEKVFNGTIIE